MAQHSWIETVTLGQAKEIILCMAHQHSILMLSGPGVGKSDVVYQSAAAAKLQAAVLNTQTARASTGQSVLPIVYASTGAGTTLPVIQTNSGAVPLTSSILSAFTPAALSTFISQYGTWVLIGGAAAFLLYAATRRKRSSST